MQVLMKSILQVGIFMICAQVLIHFRPNGSYEKYMKLLVSVLMLAMLFFPIVNLLIGGDYNMEEKVKWFEEELAKSMEEAKLTAGQTEELLNRMTMEELNERLEKQQEETGQEGSTGLGIEEKAVAPETLPEDGDGDAQVSDIHIDRIEIELGATGQ